MLLAQMTRFSTLDGHQYVALTTFRRDGQPVTTPFPFALGEDRLYVWAASGAGEIRRIHDNAQVEVAPCAASGQPLGASQEAMALALAPDQAEEARSALRREFGLRLWLWELTCVLKRERCVYLEITPM